MYLSNQARRHTAANAAIVSTEVLIYQALHDKYGFGRGRFARIENLVDGYSQHINHNGDRYIGYRDKLDDAGLDLQLKRDFIRWIKKALGISGKAERTGAEAGMEYTYTLMLYALWDVFGFRQGRLRWLQEKLKFYAGIILEGEVRIPEFMKCMALECGQKFQYLESWEKQYGELKIYG
ncbi:hypothetical protein [uncultured Megasphaera sp.]|uniref:hypothetical protein n=1 Tax=uncultured Megasphaera sp. TaxID=165188 RepID=UPI00265AD2D6|nr:hypothetical protein [uncultured Megasphaera sp.]